MIKKIKAYIFIGILFIPMMLGIIGNTTKIPVDVELKGFTDDVQKPEFAWDTFRSGVYQGKYTAWYDSDMALKGVLTKTYSTLRFELFNLGNRPIGENKDIYEPKYINAELGFGIENDFSLEQNQLEMQKFVDDLVSVHEKLQKFGKAFYVYITANKANFNYDNIPEAYKDLAGTHYERAVDCFRENIQHTDVPYLISADMKEELEYPAFYTTGIHWSRTFEQKVSERVISDIADVTGKNYRNIVLAEVKESSSPFWRDTDVFNLLNVWSEPECTYYEYVATQENLEEYDEIRWLVQGDSFAQGLRKDILDLYLLEEFYYINYDNYIVDSSEKMTMLNQNWEQLDLGYYLDNTDVVVIQMSEALINSYSSGFAEYLNGFLDVYVPREREDSYSEYLDARKGNEWPTRGLTGVYGREDGFAWVMPRCRVIIKEEDVAESGLEIEFAVPGQVFGDGIADEVKIYVNGILMYENAYAEAWTGSVELDSDRLQQLGTDTYSIEIICSKSFVPREMGLGADNRRLALRVSYVGRMR